MQKSRNFERAGNKRSGCRQPLYLVAEVIGLSHPQDQTLVSALLEAKNIVPVQISSYNIPGGAVASTTVQLGSFASALLFIESASSNNTFMRMNYPIALIPGLSSYSAWIVTGFSTSVVNLIAIDTSTTSVTVRFRNSTNATLDLTLSGLIAVLS